MATVPPSTPFTFLVRKTPGGGVALGILVALVGLFVLVVGIFFILTALTIAGVVTGLAIFAPFGVLPSDLATYAVLAVLFLALAGLSFTLAVGLLTTRGFSRLIAIVTTLVGLATTALLVFITLVLVPISLSPANILNTLIAILAPAVLTIFSTIALGYLGRPRTRVIYETPFRPFNASSFLGTPPITPTPTSATVPAVPTPVQTLIPAGTGAPFGVAIPGSFVPGGFAGIPPGFAPIGPAPFAPFAAGLLPFPYYRPFPFSTVAEQPQTINVRPVPVPVEGSAIDEELEDLEPIKPSISYCRHCGSRVNGQAMYCDHCGGRTG